MEDDDIEIENEEELKEVKEDAVVSSAEFRQWKGLSRSNQIVLELICELVALSSSDTEDNEFEDVEDDNMEEEAQNEEKIVDLDQIQQFCT